MRYGSASTPGTVRFPSAAAWARTFLDSAPVPGIASVETAVRERIVDDVVGVLGDGDGFAFPMTAHVAIAQR